MKLPDGMTVHVGGRVYEGEMPDDKAPKGLKKKLEGASSKPDKPAGKTKAD